MNSGFAENMAASLFTNVAIFKMSERKREHTSLGDVLKNFISANRLDRGLNKVSAREAWHEVMGTAISNYTTAVTLDGSTLHVQLSSSVLREELSYGKEKIIKLINDELGEELVSKLVLR